MLLALAAMFGLNTAQGYMNGLADRELIRAQNKMTREANRENTREVARTIGSIEVQKAFLRQEATRASTAAERSAEGVASSAAAQAAAAGVKGASVQAVRDNIENELFAAVDAIKSNALMQERNLNEQIISMSTQARLNLGKFQRVPKRSDVLKGAMLQSGTSTASTYFSFTGAGGGVGGAGTASGVPADMGGASIYSAGSLA